MIYATTLESRVEQCKEHGYGKDAAIKQVYPVDECEAKIENNTYSVVHIPTGTVFEKDKDYTIKLQKAYNDVYKVWAVGVDGGRLADITMERSGSILFGDGKLAPYNVNYYLQGLTQDGKQAADTYECIGHESFDGIINTMTEAVAKDFEGFTAQEISQKVKNIYNFPICSNISIDILS